MAASTKKRVIAFYCTTANIIATSYSVNGATAITKSGLSVAPSAVTTPAVLAGLFGTGLLGNAANIEAVSNIVTQSTNRMIVARLAPAAVGDTLSFSVNQSGTNRVGSIIDVLAFEDAGLSEDAEIASLTTLMSALNAAMTT